MNSPQFVRQVNAELRSVLGDDRIVTGARVLAVPPRRVLRRLSAAVYVASAVALVFVYLLARGHWHSRAALIGFLAAEAAAILLGLVRIFSQHPMLLAVTGRQLVCGRLAGAGKHLADVETAPLSRVRISVLRQPRTTTLRCLMPGRKPLMLNSVKGCQDDLDRVVDVARSYGAAVSTAQDNATNRERQHATAPPPMRGDRLGEGGRADRPGRHYGPDVSTAARPQARREHPGEHRRSGRGGGESTRS